MSADNSDHHTSWLGRLSHPFQSGPHSQKELLSILRSAAHKGLLDKEALEMMEGVLNVSKLRVRDIMIPRAQMVYVEQNQPAEVFVPIIVESSHSRFPVIGTDQDDVVGILLAKDLLKHYIQYPGQPLSLSQDLLRPAIFVPESKHLNALLREFRASHNHLAIVVDEYGSISGVVTIEDVLEEIVGEIEDEYDTGTVEYIQEIDEQHYWVHAFTPIEDFNERFNTAFSDEQIDTMGGLVMQTLERVPKTNETLTIDQLHFTIAKADNRRIKMLKLSLNTSNTPVMDS